MSEAFTEEFAISAKPPTAQGERSQSACAALREPDAVPALEARELSVELDRRPVLRELSLSVRFGEVLAVLGPNGAGKSTLLRALCGLTRSRGEVAIEGHALAKLSAGERARRVSFVPQHSALNAALCVQEVVALGRYAHRPPLSTLRAEDERAIERALADTDLPMLAARRFDQLSTGEQKRVLLARALATGARTLLLDEPSASLDIAHALALFELLRALAAEGRAIVVVLHQIEHALSYSDRALLLQNGAALAFGPTPAVLTPEHVRALYQVELIEAAAPGFRLPRGDE